MNKIREGISPLGEDIDERFGKWSIIYKKHYKTFAYLYPKPNEIHANVRLSEIEVPTKIGFKKKVKKEDVFKIAFKINSDSHLNDALNLIKEAYEKN